MCSVYVWVCACECKRPTESKQALDPRNWSSWLLWAAWWEETSGLIFLLFCLPCRDGLRFRLWVRINLLPLVALVRMLYHGDQNNHQYTYKAPPHTYICLIFYTVSHPYLSPALNLPSSRLVLLSVVILGMDRYNNTLHLTCGVKRTTAN